MESQKDNLKVTGQPNGATGATGGIGSIGKTGGPGLPGLPITTTEDATIKPLHQDEGDETMRHLVMHFQGATGAMGGKPEQDVHIEAGKPIPVETLQRVTTNMTDQIEKLNKDQTLLQLKEQNMAAEGVFGSARAKMVNIGYVIGCLLAHLKKLVMAEGTENWGDYISREFPEMSRRTREKCMNLANTSGILKHADIGVDAAELVIQAIKPIKHMLSKEDPIGDLFARSGITFNYAQIEKGHLTPMIKGVITRQKLLQKDLDVDVRVSTDFNKVAGSVTAVDIAVMLDRKEHGLSPQGYMEEVIANNGTRPNDASDTNSPKKPIKYINAETVKLKSFIEHLLEDKADLKKLDLTHLEALSTAVNNLIARCTA